MLGLWQVGSVWIAPSDAPSSRVPVRLVLRNRLPPKSKVRGKPKGSSQPLKKS